MYDAVMTSYEYADGKLINPMHKPIQVFGFVFNSVTGRTEAVCSDSGKLINVDISAITMVTPVKS